MRFVTLVLAVGTTVVSTDRATLAQKPTPPLNPVVVKTDLIAVTGTGSKGAQAYLQMTIGPKGTTSNVQIENFEILFAGRAVIAIADSPKVADALDAAAAALATGKRFDAVQVGETIVSVETVKVLEADKDNKATEVQHEVVAVTSKGLGKLDLKLLPRDARQLAEPLRVVPGIFARLKPAIDGDAIWKGK